MNEEKIYAVNLHLMYIDRLTKFRSYSDTHDLSLDTRLTKAMDAVEKMLKE